MNLRRKIVGTTQAHTHTHTITHTHTHAHIPAYVARVRRPRAQAGWNLRRVLRAGGSALPLLSAERPRTARPESAARAPGKSRPPPLRHRSVEAEPALCIHHHGKLLGHFSVLDAHSAAGYRARYPLHSAAVAAPEFKKKDAMRHVLCVEEKTRELT